MAEKKVTKISLSTFFLILTIIIIIVMSIFIYKIYNEKIEAIEKSAELQSQVNSLNGTLNDLQGKINNISETINSNASTEHNIAANDNSFTDTQVKTALENFLELRAHANCSSLIEKLEEKGILNYDSSKDTYLNDGTILTTIKFSDYKNVMLNYVSETEFNNNWISSQGFKKSDDGYLIRSQGGGGLAVYTVKNITKNDNFTYSANTTYIVDEDDTMKGNENFTFKINSYNNNCVITSIKAIDK